jgi:hypothetical protein
MAMNQNFQENVIKIKSLYDYGHYLEAKSICHEALYHCQESLWVVAGTEKMKVYIQQMTYYQALKNKVIFEQIRDYFEKKSAHGWKKNNKLRLFHFLDILQSILQEDRLRLDFLLHHAPGLWPFNEYDHLIKNIDTQDLKHKLSMIITWLKALPISQDSISPKILMNATHYQNNKNASS